MVGKDVQSWFVAFSQALLAETELSELLDFVLTFTVKQAQADGGSLLLLDEAKGELIPKASLGLVPRQVSVKLGQGIAGWVAEQTERSHPSSQVWGWLAGCWSMSSLWS